MFFDNPTGIRPVSARSLDAVQALTALHRIGSVRFRVDEDIFSLRISQAFPGRIPPIEYLNPLVFHKRVFRLHSEDTERPLQR